jgi:HPt (histidine-containing phosphotransfer) domain-containing protein
MNGRLDLDPEIFDSAILAAFQRLIPSNRVHAYLQDLDREYLMLLESSATEPNLQSRAHNIVSSAGMLGLTRMSEHAKVLENACRSGTGAAAALLECGKSAKDVGLFALPAAGYFA